jgi:hypothetical protein
MRRLEDMQPPKNLNAERRANCARRSSRFLLPRPPLRDFTTEMQAEGADSRRPLFLPAKNAGRKVRGLAPLRPPGRALVKRKPSGVTRGFVADFLWSQPHRIGLGVHARRDPGVAEFNLSWVVTATAQNRNFLLCS